MEDEILDFLKEKFNDEVKISVEHNKVRVYEITAKILPDKLICFSYVWDTNFTNSANLCFIQEKLIREISNLYLK